jgi:hypothetical protein
MMIARRAEGLRMRSGTRDFGSRFKWKGKGGSSTVIKPWTRNLVSCCPRYRSRTIRVGSDVVISATSMNTAAESTTGHTC